MENDNKKSMAIIIAIIVIILIGAGFYFSYKKSGVQTTTTEDQIPLKDGSSSSYEITAINARHQYKNGKHIYAGVIDLPTPCHSVSVAAKASGTNKYTLEFTTKTTDEICAQVITPRPFRVEFTAPKNITVDATLDGKLVTLNILEVKEGEDIDKINFNDKG
jgi:flagellar basal body-associated protein FliL